MFVPAHKVSGAEPHVPLHKHVPQEFLFRSYLVGITFELASCTRPVVNNLANRLTNFIGRAAEAKSIFIAFRHSGVSI